MKICAICEIYMYNFSHELLLFKNRFACIIFLKNALANDADNANSGSVEN